MSTIKVIFKFLISKIILINLILFSSIYDLLAFENKILIKVNNNIITTIDISDEMNYLTSLNKKISGFDKNTIISIAKNSLIKEKIKQIEIKKNLKVTSIEEKELNKLIENTYRNLGFDSLENLKKYLIKNNVSFDQFKKKIIIDRNWKQLVYNKYSEQIKFDEKAIRNKLKDKEMKSYLISEIVFRANSKDELNNKFKIIKDTIKKNDFETAAIVHSISDTSQNGGNIGWIKESSLSKKILENISKISVNEFTNPISIPGGFIIIKINNLKTEKEVLNLEKETIKVINEKINNQLNQFSNIYLNKIKNDVFINEK